MPIVPIVPGLPAFLIIFHRPSTLPLSAYASVESGQELSFNYSIFIW